MDADVAIVGLGTAGAAVAAACALEGLRVVGLDRSPLDRTGARWCNGVPGWAFEAAGFARPQGEELQGPEGAAFHLVAGWGLARVRTTSVLDVDMRHLGSRLLGLAAEGGADLRGEVTVRGLEGGRLHTDCGPIRARIYVDAGGLTGPRLDDRPTPDRRDLCVAAQQVHRVSDGPAAEAWFAQHGVQPGEILCFTGVAGGYSIVNLRLHGDKLAILTGSIPALGHAAGTTLLRRFVEAHDWVGEPIFGGSRALPLGQPHAAIGNGIVARIGDTACMVHAAHGSGIAQQLLAARLFATTVAAGGSAWEFNVAWQRRYGGVLAGADVFRRFSQTLSLADLQRLMQGGVMTPQMMRDTLLQRPVRPAPAHLARAVLRLGRMPRIASRMLPVIGRMKALELHTARYPADPASLPRWVRRRDRLTGPTLR